MLLQLYQEGLVDLDSPVSDYLIGLPQTYRDLTVRQVGSMRSGVPEPFFDPIIKAEANKDSQRYWLTDELFALAAIGPQQFPPGDDFQYSNSNSIILGLIIEKITRNSLGYEINKRILEPLNLSSTRFLVNAPLQKPRMSGYSYFDNNLKDVTDYNISYSWAAGNISSNLRNSSKFLKCAIGKELLLDRNATKTME